jgi:hypothetical protein
MAWKPEGKEAFWSYNSKGWVSGNNLNELQEDPTLSRFLDFNFETLSKTSSYSGLDF